MCNRGAPWAVPYTGSVNAPAPETASFASRRFERGLRFVLRVYLPRTVGLALGGVAVGTVLYTNGAHPLLWLALGLTSLAWPHVAYWLGKQSADPYRAELRNLTVDSALGGAWIALMQFNLMPSALLAVMLSMDKMAAGGPKFLARCTAALVGACLVVGFASGFPVRPQTSTMEIVGSLPLLIVYPLAIATTMYNMVRKLQYQNRQLETLSYTDGLSQMLTLQAWKELVGEEFIFCRRSGMPACLVLVEIDNLSAINQGYGYPAGDEVIRTVAAILRDALREDDVAGRFGGDKFGALLRNTDALKAHSIAQRVCERVETAVLERTDRVMGTVSVGIAQVDPKDIEYSTWIAKAERALQAAKARPGSSIEHFEPPGAGQRLF